MYKILNTLIIIAVLTSPAQAEYSYKGQWGRSGSYNGAFLSPWGIAAAKGGRIYVADTMNSRDRRGGAGS